MKIYISIPITGHDEAEVREHAEATKAMLRSAGHTVVNPFDIHAGENPMWEDYLCADLRQMFDCDAIYLCGGGQSHAPFPIANELRRMNDREDRKEDTPC